MRGAAASALAVEGIRVDLRGKPVLRGLDLSVAEGPPARSRSRARREGRVADE